MTNVLDPKKPKVQLPKPPSDPIEKLAWEHKNAFYPVVWNDLTPKKLKQEPLKKDETTLSQLPKTEETLREFQRRYTPGSPTGILGRLTFTIISPLACFICGMIVSYN